MKGSKMKKSVKKESKSAKMHEVQAGKKENKSPKHRHAESVGMKRALYKKFDDKDED
jgi:hypothetical protein